jgi:TolB-like protein/tetratricopeptide (TPR) repeat protein
MQLLAELRRRRVFHAAAIYAAAAWGAVEIAGFLLERVNAPGAVITSIAAAFVVGFPIAMLVAWFVDFTPGGIRRAKALPAASTVTVVAGVLLLLAGTLALAFLMLRESLTEYESADIAGTPMPNSVAVLPFANMSSDPENEYFSDGLSDMLIDRLANIDELVVISRTSSFAFKGQNVDARAIGQQLNVATLVEGSVQRLGDRLRIVAQLIRTDTGAHLWSKTFDRSVDDLFAIQDEIALKIAGDLTQHLTTEADGPPRTTDMRAFDLYLRGRHSLHKRTENDLGWAIVLFNQAIEIDPEFAPAYSGLADAYLLLPDYSSNTFSDIDGKARASIDKALALDPGLGEAQASLGLLLKSQGDYHGARQALTLAIQLNPNDAMAYMWLAITLEDQGRLDEAAPLLQRARRLDPLSFQINNRAGVNHWLRGEFDAANERFAAAIRIEDSHPNGYWGRALVSWTRGELEQAIAFYLDAIDRDPDRAVFVAQMGVVYLDLDQPVPASDWLDRAVALAPQWAGAVFARGLAIVAAGKSKDARLYATDVIAKNPNQPFIVTSGAALLALAGDLDAAARHFAEAEGLSGSEAALKNSWDIYYGVCFGAIKAAALRGAGQIAHAGEVAAETREFIEDMQSAGLGLPQARYCRASAAALQLDHEIALEELRAAFATGLRRCWYADIDPSFDRLRDNPAFLKAMALCRQREPNKGS